MRKILFVILTTLVLIFSIGLLIYQPPDKSDNFEISENWKIEEERIFSPYMGYGYKLKIALPPHYNPMDTSNLYNSIYLMDGVNFFDEYGDLVLHEGMFGITKKLVSRGSISPTILIGIEFGFLHREFVSYEAPDAFITFVQDELIPFIEERYNVDTDPESRTIIGHSDTAHFVIYQMLANAKNTKIQFSHVIAVSGDYNPMTKAYMEEELMFKELGTQALDGLNLFIPIGDEDDTTLGNYGNSSLIEVHNNFTQKLLSRGYFNFQMNATLYKGFGHLNIAETAFEDGLRWFFASNLKIELTEFQYSVIKSRLGLKRVG